MEGAGQMKRSSIPKRTRKSEPAQWRQVEVIVIAIVSALPGLDTSRGVNLLRKYNGQLQISAYGLEARQVSNSSRASSLLLPGNRLAIRKLARDLDWGTALGIHSEAQQNWVSVVMVSLLNIKLESQLGF
jgi:hypothetical protein